MIYFKLNKKLIIADETSIVHRFSYVLFALVIVLSFAACSGSGAGQTLYDLKDDLAFPNDVHKKIPAPKESNLRMTTDVPDDYYAMINPNVELSYSNMVDFFIEGFKKYDWKIIDEKLPEEEEGYREVMWKVEGHGVEMEIEYTYFEKGLGMTSSVDYFIYEQ